MVPSLPCDGVIGYAVTLKVHKSKYRIILWATLLYINVLNYRYFTLAVQRF